MNDDYQPSHVLNARDHPRILVRVAEPRRYAWVDELPGTHKFIGSIGEVDATEWDVLVTDQPTSEYRLTNFGHPTLSVRRLVPAGLWIFRVLAAESGVYNDRLIDFGSIEGRDVSSDDKKTPLTRLNRRDDVPGHVVRRISGLPEALQELVATQLVPAVEVRRFQFGIGNELSSAARPEGLREFRPFLAGPDGLVLACSYVRLDGGQGWVVPDDVPDIAAWFRYAMHEWHLIAPKVFPGIAAWQTSEAWMTREERQVADDLRRARDTFEGVRQAHELAEAAMTRRLEQLRAQVDGGRRVLLTGQGDALQEACKEALSSLGFEVEDMDSRWDPRERREDFRIRDAQDPSWLVLADATGVQKGGRASKLQTVSGYVSKFVHEERPESIPGQWVLLNRLFDRDPEERGQLFRSDELAVFASQSGLAIDTVALFVLVEACSSDVHREAARAWLRGSTGEISLDAAREWVAGHISAPHDATG